MKKIKQIAVLVASIIGASACTMIDDYMLGADNTDKPSELTQITPKISLNKRWDQKVSPVPAKAPGLYDLSPAMQDKVIYSASATGFVQARSEGDGQLLWTTDIKAPISSGPSVNKDFVVVGSEASVVALSAKEGKVIWRATVSNELLASPILSKDRVFAKTIDGQLFSFQSTDGKQVWRYAHGSPDLILRASSKPVIVGDLILSGFSDGKLDAFNAKTGQLMWQRNVSYSKGHTSVERMIDLDSTPIVKNNVIYLATYQGEVVALSLKDGHTLWRHPVSVFKNMTVSEEALFVVDSNSNVLALALSNGMVLWQQKAMHNRSLNSPVVSKNGLVLTDGFGYLHILSLNTGEIIAQEKMAAYKTYATPLVNDTDVYVLFENGLLTDYMMVS